MDVFVCLCVSASVRTMGGVLSSTDDIPGLILFFCFLSCSVLFESRVRYIPIRLYYLHYLPTYASSVFPLGGSIRKQGGVFDNRSHGRC